MIYAGGHSDSRYEKAAGFQRSNVQTVQFVWYLEPESKTFFEKSSCCNLIPLIVQQVIFSDLNMFSNCPSLKSESVQQAQLSW